MCSSALPNSRFPPFEKPQNTMSASSKRFASNPEGKPTMTMPSCAALARKAYCLSIVPFVLKLLNTFTDAPTQRLAEKKAGPLAGPSSTLMILPSTMELLAHMTEVPREFLAPCGSTWPST